MTDPVPIKSKVELSYCQYCRKELIIDSEIQLGSHNSCLLEITNHKDIKQQNMQKSQQTYQAFIQELGIPASECRITHDGSGHIDVLIIESNFEFTHLPSSISNFPSLTGLIVTDSRLQSLPDTIGDLSRLTHLDLQRNSIESLPETIGQLTNLQTLWLNNNNLISVPASFGQLTNLQDLSLYNNRGINKEVFKCPEELRQLMNLRILDLRNLRLNRIPETVFEMQNVCVLRLAGNNLTEVPNQIMNMKNLSDLDISGNEIQVFPEIVGDLPNLNSLTFDEHLFDSLPDSIKHSNFVEVVWDHGIIILERS